MDIPRERAEKILSILLLAKKQGEYGMKHILEYGASIDLTEEEVREIIYCVDYVTEILGDPEE